MLKSLQKMEYFETYYYANVLHNILSDPYDWLRNLNEWHENQAESLFSTPFKKWSVLHDLAGFIIESIMYQGIDDITEDSLVHNSEYELWVDKALRHHGFHSIGFRKWLKDQQIELDNLNEDLIHQYHHELMNSGELESLIEQLANEVFHILFANRALLANLNLYISGTVSEMELLEQEEPNRFKRAGVLNRVHIPEWAKRATFYRDRGRCASCNTDLSGLISLETKMHIDHIIPLAKGGINDVTNLQLLCEGCNGSKSADIIAVSSTYEAWYV